MAAHVNGNDNIENGEEASMLEQLLPETSMHVLSLLDYQSLCRLSMTNSHMRRAANDDNVWKALYHKDFTLEQDSVTPANGWKAYYAATRAVVSTNAKFLRIIRERSLRDMRQFWLNADYVKCFHVQYYSGYDAVMENWQLEFASEIDSAYQIIQDVRARVTADVAWLTMKAYIDMENIPYNLTNVYEFHDGSWFMVEAYITEHIRPLCKSGVITVEQYRWAVGKTTEKVMKYHSKEKNANFLIKEGEKVKKLAEQYVEASSQQKTKT